MAFAKPLAELIAELEKLPGVGPRSAQRLAYHILKTPTKEVERLASALVQAKHALRMCERCFNFSAHPLCEICSDPRRTTSQICVLAEPREIAAIERTHEYHGTYHVLHGLLSPMEGVMPEHLRVKELIARLQTETVEEVILATNPTIEGDATALYLTKLLKPTGIRITRLAHGMPIGGELDYADSATLISAFEYRREV